jgi:hypothetical protein
MKVQVSQRIEMVVTRVAKYHARTKEGGKVIKPAYIDVELEDLRLIEPDEHYPESKTHLGFQLGEDATPPRLGDKATVEIVFL